jgi:hypothetical protein
MSNIVGKSHKVQAFTAKRHGKESACNYLGYLCVAQNVFSENIRLHDQLRFSLSSSNTTVCLFEWSSPISTYVQMLTQSLP